MSVVPGQLAPDTVFDDGCGRPFAFHRLRGRHVTIVFWQSWSAPCVAQLRELQSQVERQQRDGAAAIGVHGGPKEGLERIRRELGIDFPLVQDSEQRIASAYGIRCWPATVTIDGDGRLEHVQFGVARGRAQGVGVAGCGRDGT
jgi:peroxiredoxin